MRNEDFDIMECIEYEPLISGRIIFNVKRTTPKEQEIAGDTKMIVRQNQRPIHRLNLGRQKRLPLAKNLILMDFSWIPS